jgi:hypothetical protein
MDHGLPWEVELESQGNVKRGADVERRTDSSKEKALKGKTPGVPAA